MKGDDVEDCQKLLIEKKYNPGKVDGVFGKATKIAVQNFQTDSKLNVNRLGVVGKKTALALGFIWEG
jgi:carboxyl-terminal processing protease